MHFQTFDSLYQDLRGRLTSAPIVKPSHWQGRNVENKPDMETFEVFNYHSSLWLPDEDLEGYRKDIKPDLPWADDHFLERVCGYPMNPGTEWANWRMGGAANDFRGSDGRFNHNYMERIWPKHANQVPPSPKPMFSELRGLDPHFGIRYAYGDLDDLVNLLVREPLTRQAYLPIFMPEDTGAVHKDRTPCTLGWHFIQRGGRLHLVYFLRSCDAVNHFRNDVYMAVRLLLWVLDETRKRDFETWDLVLPGTLTMHVTSMHCFRGTFNRL